ncbi:MAG: protease inhibitor I42 family protein [Coxiellaceae bacterium]|nr:protease inhibitor I42 family protein [Coxiellaceae bacterium]
MKSFISLAVFCFVAVALASVQSSDYNKPIMVKSSMPQVTVTLPGNKTTGYSWFLESYDATYIRPMKQQYKAPQQDIPGAPGESVWTFRILDTAFEVPRILRVKMVYGRPWDLADARTKIITIITH